MTDRELVGFLQWALPRLGLRWAGFRKVRGTLRKRITRRLDQLGITGLAGYRRFLEDHPGEWHRLENLCRIPISRFFRDRAVYDTLAHELLPSLAWEARENGRAAVRVLSAGCASGEEPYSVALAWSVEAGPAFSEVALDVLAVDADDTMLERARAGCYGRGSLKDVPPSLVEHAFEPRDGLLCLGENIRRTVRFERCNLASQAPPGPFELVLCRNVAFTYFDDAAQRACLEGLRKALRDDGVLVVGSHERLPDGQAGFEHVREPLPVYRKDPPVVRGSGGPLVIDGSHGEGGGQILRTAVTLSVLTGRPFRIERVRANRQVPGLAAQHVTAARAAASLCDAALTGDSVGSRELTFMPRRPATAGGYLFDVAAARQGGSAGSTTLVLQTVLLPLALAHGRSTVVVEGGTHLKWSPPFDFVRGAWLPALWRLGIEADVVLDAWGWYPAGGGSITCRIAGRAAARRTGLQPLDLMDPGPLDGVTGRAVAARLPSHIAARMRDLAIARLVDEGIACHVDAVTADSVSPGAGIFLIAHYRNVRCGFSAIGKRGVPAEKVAAEAVAELLAHRATGAALDRHLADQMLLPLTCASGPSRITIERVSAHVETNAWVIERFGVAGVTIAEGSNGTGIISVVPLGFAP